MSWNSQRLHDLGAHFRRAQMAHQNAEQRRRKDARSVLRIKGHLRAPGASVARAGAQNSIGAAHRAAQQAGNAAQIHGLRLHAATSSNRSAMASSHSFCLADGIARHVAVCVTN
jgi:hypothetical protein